MKHSVVITGILIFLISLNSYSQETKRKRVQKGAYIEEYNVLKKNKKIKEGQYIRFKKDMLDRKIPVEFGFFENDIRVGEWYFFYPNGALKSFGSYKGGEKYGLWKEYYKPVFSKEKSITSIFNIQSDINIDENGIVTVQKKDKLISAMGVYESNRKLGAWNYYDSRGNLIHKYDHSLDSLLISSLPDSLNVSYPYLGGKERFYQYYFDKDEELGYKESPSESKVILRIEVEDKSLTIERVSSTGDENVVLKVEKIIRSIPNDWIKSCVEKPTLMVWELKRDLNKMAINAVFKQTDDNKL